MACVEAAIACWRSRGWEQDSGERLGLWAIAQRTDAHMAAVGGNSAVFLVVASMISGTLQFCNRTCNRVAEHGIPKQVFKLAQVHKEYMGE